MGCNNVLELLNKVLYFVQQSFTASCKDIFWYHLDLLTGLGANVVK